MLERSLNDRTFSNRRSKVALARLHSENPDLLEIWRRWGKKDIQMFTEQKKSGNIYSTKKVKNPKQILRGGGKVLSILHYWVIF